MPVWMRVAIRRPGGSEEVEASAEAANVPSLVKRV